MAKIAPECRYSEEHEWVATRSDSVAWIGVSAVAADALGEIVYLDLPEAGSEVTAGSTCGEIESTKSVSDLYSPVTGAVVEVNQEAIDNPALVNEDPYGAGWLFTVEVSSEGPLMSAQEYASKNGGEL